MKPWTVILFILGFAGLFRWILHGFTVSRAVDKLSLAASIACLGVALVLLFVYVWRG